MDQSSQQRQSQPQRQQPRNDQAAQPNAAMIPALLLLPYPNVAELQSSSQLLLQPVGITPNGLPVALNYMQVYLPYLVPLDGSVFTPMADPPADMVSEQSAAHSMEDSSIPNGMHTPPHAGVPNGHIEDDDDGGEENDEDDGHDGEVYVSQLPPDVEQDIREQLEITEEMQNPGSTDH